MADAFDALAAGEDEDEDMPMMGEDDDMTEDSKAAETQAAADLIEAMQSKDTQSLLDAFKRMQALCKPGSYDE